MRKHEKYCLQIPEATLERKCVLLGDPKSSQEEKVHLKMQFKVRKKGTRRFRKVLVTAEKQSS